MKIIRIAVAVVACTAAVATRHAGAAVFCGTAKRAVVERTACRPGETPIPRTELSVDGAPGAAGPAGTPGPQAASFVDAAGRPVGPLLHVTFFPGQGRKGYATAYALFEDASVGGLAALGVDPAGGGGGTVYWTGAGCTGTALVQDRGLLPVLQTVNDAVFFPTTSAPPTVLRARETADTSTGCTALTANLGCCIDVTGNPSPTAGLAVAGRTTLGALGLQAPFAARVD
jgi:hypothetical protein